MRIFVTLLFVLGIFTAGAQVINIEKQRKDSERVFYGKVQTGFKFEEGANSLWNTSNYAHLNLQIGKHLLMSFTSWEFISSNKEKVQDKGYEHLRYNYLLNDLLTIELFGQYQFNDQRKIEYRALGGAGVRTSLLSLDSLQWSLGTSAMYEERKFTYDSANMQQNWRLNLYTNINWAITDNIRFSSIVYYQPAFDDFRNYNLSGEGKLSIGLIKKLSFFVSAMVTYEEEPPEGLSEFYSVIKNGLSLIF